MKTDSINFDRIRHLHQFLMNQLIAEQMDMNSVISVDSFVDFKKVKAGDPAHCGAIGCAIGWAALIPEFREEGLKYTKNGLLKLDNVNTDYNTVGQEFFGLTDTQAVFLFGPQRESEFDLDHQSTFDLRCHALFALCEKKTLHADTTSAQAALKARIRGLLS